MKFTKYFLFMVILAISSGCSEKTESSKSEAAKTKPSWPVASRVWAIELAPETKQVGVLREPDKLTVFSMAGQVAGEYSLRPKTISYSFMEGGCLTFLPKDKQWLAVTSLNWNQLYFCKDKHAIKWTWDIRNPRDNDKLKEEGFSILLSCLDNLSAANLRNRAGWQYFKQAQSRVREFKAESRKELQAMLSTNEIPGLFEKRPKLSPKEQEIKDILNENSLYIVNQQMLAKAKPVKLIGNPHNTDAPKSFFQPKVFAALPSTKHLAFFQMDIGKREASLHTPNLQTLLPLAPESFRKKLGKAKLVDPKCLEKTAIRDKPKGARSSTIKVGAVDDGFIVQVTGFGKYSGSCPPLNVRQWFIWMKYDKTMWLEDFAVLHVKGAIAMASSEYKVLVVLKDGTVDLWDTSKDTVEQAKRTLGKLTIPVDKWKEQVPVMISYDQGAGIIAMDKKYCLIQNDKLMPVKATNGPITAVNAKAPYLAFSTWDAKLKKGQIHLYK